MRKQQKSSLYFKCQGIKALIWRGSLFHNLRAAAIKSRLSLCFNLDLGTARSTCSADLSDLLGVCKLKGSERQGGANLCLKNNKIWKSILKLNSSQCKDVPCLLPYDVWHNFRQRCKPEFNQRKKMDGWYDNSKTLWLCQRWHSVSWASRKWSRITRNQHYKTLYWV